MIKLERRGIKKSHEFRGGGHPGRAAAAIHAQAFYVFHESLDAFELRQRFRARRALGNFEVAAQLKPLHDRLEVCAFEMSAENFSDRTANHLARDIFRAAEFAFVFQLHFSRNSRKRGVIIRDARARA